MPFKLIPDDTVTKPQPPKGWRIADPGAPAKSVGGEKDTFELMPTVDEARATAAQFKQDTFNELGVPDKMTDTSEPDVDPLDSILDEKERAITERIAGKKAPGLPSWIPEKQVVPGQTQEGTVTAAPPKNWKDAVREVRDNPQRFFPFMNDMEQLQEVTGVALAVNRLNSGKESQEDLALIKDYLDRKDIDSRQEHTFWYNVLDGASRMPAFMGEMAVTFGLYNTGKTAAMKGMQKLSPKLVKSLMQNKLGELGLKSAAGVAGATLQTPAVGLVKIPKDFIERTMPDVEITADDKGILNGVVVDDGEDVLPAIKNAMGDTWVEVVSERSGGLFSGVAAPIRNKLVKSAIASGFLKSNPGARAKDFAGLVNKMGWNGIVGEMLEERAGEVGRAGLGIEDYKLPSKEQLLTELVTFSIPGAVIGTTNIALNRSNDIPPGGNGGDEGGVPANLSPTGDTSPTVNTFNQQIQRSGKINPDTGQPFYPARRYLHPIEQTLERIRMQKATAATLPTVAENAPVEKQASEATGTPQSDDLTKTGAASQTTASTAVDTPKATAQIGVRRKFADGSAKLVQDAETGKLMWQSVRKDPATGQPKFTREYSEDEHQRHLNRREAAQKAAATRSQSFNARKNIPTTKLKKYPILTFLSKVGGAQTVEGGGKRVPGELVDLWDGYNVDFKTPYDEKRDMYEADVVNAFNEMMQSEHGWGPGQAVDNIYDIIELAGNELDLLSAGKDINYSGRDAHDPLQGFTNEELMEMERQSRETEQEEGASQDDLEAIQEDVSANLIGYNPQESGSEKGEADEDGITEDEVDAAIAEFEDMAAASSKQETPQEEAPAKKPWQIREEEIAAQVQKSKQSGAKHLDSMPLGVEALRGRRFKSFRDGKDWIATSVDNRGVVYFISLDGNTEEQISGDELAEFRKQPENISDLSIAIKANVGKAPSKKALAQAAEQYGFSQETPTQPKLRNIKADPTIAPFDTVDSRTREPIKQGEPVYHFPDTNEFVRESTYRNIAEIPEQGDLGLEPATNKEAESAQKPVVSEKTTDKTGDKKPVQDVLAQPYSVKEEAQQNMFAELEGKIDLFDQPVKNDPVADIGKMGLHIIDTPSGKYTFAGSVPGELLYIRKDGSKPTEEQLQGASHAGPGFVGLATRMFDTREDAMQAARDAGIITKTPKKATTEKQEAAKLLTDRNAKLPKRLGKNANGVTVFEDDNGIRYINDQGVRIESEVTYDPNGKVYRKTPETLWDEGQHRFLTTEEYNKYSKGKTKLGQRMQEQYAGWKNRKQETGPTPVNIDRLANTIVESLRNKEKMDNNALFRMADKSFGGTQAEGVYTVKDAHDALELAVNHMIDDSSMSLPVNVDDEKALKDTIHSFNRLMNLLPTQGSKRTIEMETYQQFSTPPPLALMVNWAANIDENDTVLEPSAGTGNIAVIARAANPKDIIVNELSERRAEILKLLGFDKVFTENAEQLNNILPKSVSPSVVVMNPPFSATAGRTRSNQTKYGARHIEQALARLEPGGRLVAIVGRGMSDSAPAFRDWWSKIKSKYTVRANIGVNGKEYQKYGTTFDNQVIVIDKIKTDDYITLTGKADKIADLIPLLKGVRNERTRNRQAERDAGRESTGVEVPEATETSGGQKRASRGDSDTVGTGSERVHADGGLSGDTGRASQAAAGYTGKGVTAERAAGMGAEERTKSGAGSTGTAGGITDGKSVESVKVSSSAQSQSKITDSIYETYSPKAFVDGAKPHPTPLVESAAMAASSLPEPTYSPSIPKETIETGELSDIQLEAITYAGQAHEDILPSGERRGFFIGDGTGVGKGREIAGIIHDNWNKGRQKAVWISEKWPLAEDAQRDLKGILWPEGADKLFTAKKIKLGSKITADEGILFLTYDTVRGTGKKSYNEIVLDQPSTLDNLDIRINQIRDWLGEDFDGVIAFDESHNMANATEVKGSRGKKQASGRAKAGMLLAKLLPKARVVYVSATGATDVNNLAYLSRLGLWGEGAPFSNMESAIAKIASGGTTAMELVAQNLKTLGLYIARSLAYESSNPDLTVTYDRHTHKLTQGQTTVYNKLAEAWQIILADINKAVETTQADGTRRGAALSAFWGAQQRFFNSIITSMQLPSTIERMKEDIADGKSVVIQLTGTGEAQQERSFARMQEGDDLEDLDMTPRDSMMGFLENSFPVDQYEEFIDENGNNRSRPVFDSQGNPIQNTEAIEMRDKLLSDVAAIKIPQSPLDYIVEQLGADIVAEITGRKRRLSRDPDTGEMRIEKRSDKIAEKEVAEFNDGKRSVLVFSEKGGTGRSYHADMRIKNQQKRVHYLVQPGWRADKAVQGLGRTHRSNQRYAPEYVLVTTNLKAQARFTSTIARRLDQLGALTKGQRETGSQGIFNARDNLESQYAIDALRRFIENVATHTYDNIHPTQFEQQTGLKITSDQGVNVPTIQQFLNRMLSLTTDMQETVFDAFSDELDAVIQAHAEAGTLDVGIQTITGLSTKKVKDTVVHTDPRSGAETRYVQVDVETEANHRPFERVNRIKDRVFYRNKKSGKIWVAPSAGRGTKTDQYGDVINTARLIGANEKSAQTIEEDVLNDVDKWEILGDTQAKTLWDSEYDALPKTLVSHNHLITGALLPIWDRLQGQATIYRLQTDDGERLLGRVVPQASLAQTLRNLGVGAENVQTKPEDIESRVMHEHATARLANGWRLKRVMVSGDERMEIKGPSWEDHSLLESQGVIIERVNWETRYFVPTGTKMPEVLDRITANRPVVQFQSAYHGPKLTDEKYSINTTPYAAGITRADVEKIFPWADSVSRDANKNFVVQKNGYRVKIKSVEQITPDKASFKVEYGRKPSDRDVITGKYHKGEITLSKHGDTWTLGHESWHWLEDLGIIPKQDIALVNRTIAKRSKKNVTDIKEGDRAQWFEDMMRKRDTAEKGAISRIIQKVADFIDSLVNLFHRTAGGIRRDVESGKVWENEARAAMGQDIRYAVAKNKQFEFSNPATEQRFNNSSGVKDASWHERFSEWFTTLKNRAVREYEHLPNTEEFAQLKFDLLKLSKQKAVATDKTLRELKAITSDLSTDDYDLFTRKVVLDDLAAMVEEGEDYALPFGFDAETVQTESTRLNQYLDGNDAVQKAVARRTAAWSSLKSQYVTAMKQAGVDVEERVSRKNYFRHQVLDYANLKSRMSGTGKKLKAPTGRGFLKQREGSQLDINTDYIQAEHEVMSQMMYDIEVAKTIKSVDTNYNIMDALKARATVLNDELMLSFFQKIADQENAEKDPDEMITAEDIYRRTLNTKQAMGFQKLGKLAFMGELPEGPGFKYKALIQKLVEDFATNNGVSGIHRVPILTDADMKQLMEYAGYLLKAHGGEIGSGAAATIFKGIREKKQIIKDTLGERFRTWENMIPDGYVLWQPREGNVFFLADTIPAKVAEQLAENQLATLGISADVIKKAIMMGGKRRQFVLKEEVAATLDNLMGATTLNPFSEAHRKLIRGWKVWQLTSPRRFFKYNVRNMTGDADAAFVGNPGTFSKIPQAISELRDAYGSTKRLTGNIKDWFERGGTISTLQAQEMGDLNRLKIFADLHKRGKKASDIPKNIWNKYWEAARISTDFREGILRYAAYLDYLEQMRNSKDGKPNNYGASRPEEIDALNNINDRAFWLSNDLLGAYDRVSVLGQGIRAHLFPFWSWKEVNAKRYIQLAKNLAHDDHLASAVGRKLVGTATRSPLIILRAGRFAIMASMMLALTNAWNRMLFPDEDDDLPEDIRSRPHITFWRNGDGEVQYFSRIGALGDLLEWGNLDAAPYYVNQFLQGKMSIKEIALDMAKAPANIFVSGTEPFGKTAMEIITRRSLYPDAFKPGTIRDRIRYVARSFGLEHEYDMIVGKPSRGYTKSLRNMFIYQSDPLEAAYWDLLDEKRRFLKKHGRAQEGFMITPRGNALYNFKRALRYGDQKAAKKYLAEYIERDGTAKGLKQSLESMNPIYGMDAFEIAEFSKYLSDDDKAMVIKALQYYEQILKTEIPDGWVLGGRSSDTSPSTTQNIAPAPKGLAPVKKKSFLSTIVE